MHGTPEEPGVIGMAVEQLFFAIESTPERRFLMQVSYLEIYNEMVNDLLSDPKTRPGTGLKVRENEEGFYVEGLSQKTVTSPEEIHRFVNCKGFFLTILTVQVYEHGGEKSSYWKDQYE